MSVLGATVAVWLVARGGRRTGLAGVWVAVLWWRPWAAVVVAVGAGLGWLLWKVTRRRREEDVGERELALLGELVLVGLTAGLSLGGALELTSGELRGSLGAEVSSLLRDVRRIGSAGALSRSGGRIGTLCVRLAQAQVTGAGVAEAVASFVGEQRDAERLRLLEEARRLPVRMMIPLALLILPGFALLTAGPSILASLQRLSDPLWSSLPPVVGRMPT